MAADLVITTIRPVVTLEQSTGSVNEAVAAGQYVRLHVTTGYVELGKGTNAAEARKGGLALHAAAAQETVTFVRKGTVDVGEPLLNPPLADDVFLSDTDGTLAATAGTVTLIVGTVVPGWGATTAAKLLQLDL